ncbi:MAG: SURF1 family cytochrome oxidase biogenesis protein [Candidatus Planktophila sp.]
MKQDARTKATIKKVLQAFTVLLLVSVFLGLGFWQLSRANEMQNPKVAPVDRKIYALAEMAQSTGSLPAESIRKKVAASGYYIANYKAPNQIDGNGAVADWEVALLQNETDTAILVVRGLWKDRLKAPNVSMANRVDVVGTLMPQQFDDRAANTPSQLSRLDSSILVSTTDLQLYDGFILSTSAGISPPKLTSGVPGYYWQHISYVVVWWFMAGLVIWMPFYKRREDKL